MESAPISIAYDLGEHGWSKFTLTVGDQTTEVGAFGYCTDALGDLVRAALAIAASAFRAEVSLDGEPMEWRLIVQREWRSPVPDLFAIKVLVFEDIYERQAEDAGDLEFEAHATGDAFARAVAAVAQAIWDEHGADGYNRLWAGSDGFPLKALRALQKALETEEPAPAPPDLDGATVIVLTNTANDV